MQLPAPSSPTTFSASSHPSRTRLLRQLNFSSQWVTEKHTLLEPLVSVHLQCCGATTANNSLSKVGAGCLGRPEEGGASSHIPDPLSHPFPPPPLPPTPRLAVRAPVLGVIREPNLDYRRPVHRVSGTAGDPEKAPPATHTATLACSTSSGSHELVSTCWQLQLQAETLPAPPPRAPPG